MGFPSSAPKMSRLFGIATLAATVAVGMVACKSSDEGASGPVGYCQTAASANKGKCAEGIGPCDEAIARACGSLPQVLSASTMGQAQGCLESGVCGVSLCMARSQKGATPTKEHKTLAANFCQFCAPNVENCEASFYQRSGKLPGVLVLPYSGDVAKAVDDACTGQDGCQAAFRACATETIAAALGNALDVEAAECVAAGFTTDEGEQPGPGGKPQYATCTPDNCKGCCRDDKCEPGDQLTACGAKAGACQICAGGQQCTSGVCKEPCGPNNCPGCCDGDTCIAGTANDKCGDRGAACKGCTAGLVCSNHKCIDGSCKATCANGCCSGSTCSPGTATNACGFGGEACVDCGYGRRCAQGACVIDPNSLWNFYVSFAVLPDLTKSGSAWDPLNGAPDAFLNVFSSAAGMTHSGTTTVQMDSTFPFWAETPLKGIKASELLTNLSFEVWDQDPDFDDFIGGCKIPLTAAVFDGSLQSYVCPATPTTGEVKLYYRVNPGQ